MSTAGSVRSGDRTQYGPPSTGGDSLAPASGRVRVFRWRGIIPLVLALSLAFAGWMMFGERVLRGTLSEAGSKAFGAQLDIAGVKVRAFASTVELRGIALADPFDRNRNLLEAGALRLELEPAPLLEKKIVVKRLTIADVRTGTRRTSPARTVSSGGFASRAMAEVQRFARQFNVPLLSLTNIGELRDVVLDPTKLKGVQSALALARDADSVKAALEDAYASLRIQETLDSSAALVTRLHGASVRTLGIDGTRRAIADVRAAAARVDAAKARVEQLVADGRRGVDALHAGARGIDVARREDYAFARSLLRLPSFEGPEIGPALFGKVTIDRFQQALYWSSLAREYAPPGLLPRETDGPKRMRLAGTTVHFATPRSYPRFLLKRADVNVVVSEGVSAGTYAFAASDVTTDPAIVGKPTLFVLRRRSRDPGGTVDSMRATGSLDHLGARPRELVNVQAVGVKLPPLPIPSLPYSMDPGRGTSELRFALDGEQLSGRWIVRSTSLTWKTDSARSRPLNTVETLVARVLTGVSQLDLVAEISGTIQAPKLAIRSNLDRQIAEQLRSVAGEEIAAAEARVRAQVDRFVDEKSAPAKARIAELRTETERRVAEARSKLEDEKQRLEERLKALGGGLVPRLPGAA